MTGKKHIKEKKFPPHEIYNLVTFLAEFIHPRLLAFQKQVKWGAPLIRETTGRLKDTDAMSMKDWRAAIGKMAWAFGVHLEDYLKITWTKKDQARYEEGMQLFVKHFSDLWD